VSKFSTNASSYQQTIAADAATLNTVVTFET